MKSGVIKNSKFFRLSVVLAILNLIFWFAAALSFRVTENVELFSVLTFGIAISVGIVVFAAGIIWALNPNDSSNQK